MEVEEAAATDNIAASLFCSCSVCRNMDSSDIQVLGEYVEEACQKSSLSTTIKLAVEFCGALRVKKSARTEKHLQNGTAAHARYNFDESEITRHLLYCVSTKSATLRNMICTTKAMKMLIESQTVQQTSTAIKLLQSSQPAGKPAGGSEA